MTAPIIQFYGVDDGGNESPSPITLLPLVSTTGGAVKAGTDSKAYRLRVYNDKGVSNPLTSDATDIDITTIGANALVTDKWIHGSFDNISYSTGIGGTTVLPFPGDIAAGDFTDIYLKATVPPSASPSTYPHLYRVSYSYS